MFEFTHKIKEPVYVDNRLRLIDKDMLKYVRYQRPLIKNEFYKRLRSSYIVKSDMINGLVDRYIQSKKDVVAIESFIGDAERNGMMFDVNSLTRELTSYLQKQKTMLRQITTITEELNTMESTFLSLFDQLNKHYGS